MSKYYETHTAVWQDTRKKVSVNIARMDIQEVALAWGGLTEAQWMDMDTNVFYFVDTKEDFDRLFDENNGEDFFLIREDEEPVEEPVEEPSTTTDYSPQSLELDGLEVDTLRGFLGALLDDRSDVNLPNRRVLEGIYSRLEC